MMRPEAIALPPKAPTGVTFDSATKTISWTDNSIADTAYVVQKLVGGTWTDLQTFPTDLAVPNTTGTTMSYVDPASAPGDQYRVQAQNTVGDTADYSDPGNEIPPGSFAFPVVTATSISATVTAS